MKMTCLIVDDEPLARKGMKEYIDEIDFLELVAVCENPLKASSVLHKQKVDLLFLDIQMPKISGIEFLKTLADPPLVIFTTAFPEYALEGYSLDVLDYLLKPVSFDRFLKAVNKARDYHLLKHHSIVAEAENKADYFFVKSAGKFEKIFFDDLLFAEALQNYVALHSTEKKMLSYLTLSSLEKQLPPGQFLKVHKSYIVSINKINSVEGNLIVIGDHHIPISRNLKDDIMARVVENKLLKR